MWGDLVWQQRGDSGIHHNRWGVGWKFDLLGSLDGPSWRTKHYDKLAAFYCSLLKFALATQLYNQFLFSKNPKLGVLKYHVPPHDLSLSQSGRISMAHWARALVATEARAGTNQPRAAAALATPYAHVRAAQDAPPLQRCEYTRMKAAGPHERAQGGKARATRHP